MKIKITRQDGTVVELEGDAAQLQAILPHVLPVQFNLGQVTLPTYVVPQSPFEPPPFRFGPNTTGG